MTKSTRTLGLLSTVLAMALLGVSSFARADEEMTQTPHSMTKSTQATVTVTAIDRDARTATMQSEDGTIQTVDVPKEVKAYDTLKVGDKIDIDYQQAVAVSILPRGAKPSMSETQGVDRMAYGVGGSARQTKVSAEVISVDYRTNRVAFKGPRGRTETVAVTDPALQKKLPELKPGQVVQVTYTEAIVAAIRPTAPSKMTP